MTNKLYLRRLYLDSMTYLLFSLIQLILITTLLTYISLDFHNRIKEPLVFKAELFIAILMFIDVMIYSYLNSFKISILTCLEWISIVSFIGVYGFMVVQGFSVLDEEIEIGLLAVRVVLQVLRLVLGVVRAKTHLSERSAAGEIELRDEIDIELETDNKDMHAYI